MKTVLFSTKSYERPFFDEANREAGSPHELTFHEARLTETTRNWRRITLVSVRS